MLGLFGGGAGREFFAGFGPGVDPAALAAGESVAGGCEDVADVGDREGVDAVALADMFMRSMASFNFSNPTALGSAYLCNSDRVIWALQ